MSARHSASRLAAWILAVSTLGTSAVAGSERQQPAVLDLVINKVPHGEIVVHIGEGEIWCDVAALERAGLRGFAGDRETRGNRVLVGLRSLAPAVRFELDETALELRLTVAPALFGQTERNILSERPPGIEQQHVPSAFLNYGASLATSGSNAATIEGGVSARGALLTSTAFSDLAGRFLRGQTSVTVDDQQRMNRLIVGDTVAATGALGGSVQLAGVSVSRDYSLDPYFVRYPTIGLSGAVMTPSRVEVYVNDQLVRVEQLPPGVYQLNQLPLPVGTANTRVVVRDAFGGQQEFDSSYYISAGVLARGLHQFAYSAGVERLRPFEASWEYGRAAVLGLHRYGVTDSVTAGGRFEWRNDLASGGPSVTTRIGHFGEVETIAAASRTGGRTGYAGSIAYEYSARAGGVAVAVRHMSPEYATFTTLAMIERPRLDVAASVTTRVTSRASLGASWQARSYYRGAPDARRGAVTTTIGVGRRISVFLSATRSLVEARWDTGGFAGLGVALGPRQSVNLSSEHDRGLTRTTVDAQRALPYGPGYGYRVQSSAAHGAAADLDAELRAQSSFGRYTLRQLVVNGQADTSVDLSGGLIAIGGGVHAVRPVEDGFALIRVPGVAGVRTYVSHQEVGRTDRNGNLVVPGLLAYYGNHVSIADSDIPADREVQKNETLIAPPYRGGALALFPALRPWRVSGRIVMMRGTSVVVPANGMLQVATGAGWLESDLGSDGAYYLEGVAPGDYRARVTLGADTCDFTLHVPRSDAPVIRGGVATCSAMVDPEPRERP